MLVDNFNAIGGKLLYFRKKSGMTQAEVAEKAGISDRTYADIERGTVNMRIETFIRICNVLCTTPDEILVFNETADEIEQDKIIERLNLCTKKERKTALEILSAYLKSLE